MQAARDMVAEIPLDVVRAYLDFLDGFLAVPYHVMVRFGMWEEILEEPEPPADLLASRAFWHYARAVALASLGRVEQSGRELALLRDAAEAVPGTRYVGNNAVRTVLEVGLPMAEGELEYRRGNHNRAFALLRTAVERDVALRYDEPWGWMMPVRHALGALLLEQGKLPEAEEVYRADLLLHPDNGWALHGLAETLRRLRRYREADSLDARFRVAWKRSDITIRASCFCRPGAA
jgi:tetratricopeptide (TPR) repeat protein